MEKKGVFVLFLILTLFSIFAFANPYGNNILDSKKVPSSMGYHELRLIVNGSDLYSVDANENGIIDVAESVLGGGAYWLPAVLGIYYMGNVGVGENDPQRKLHISATQDANIRLQDTDASDATAAYIEFYNETDRLGAIGIPGDNSSDYLVIATEKGKDIVMLPSGNVGIGTTNPRRELHIYDATGGAEIIIEGQDTVPMDLAALTLASKGAVPKEWVMTFRRDNPANRLQFQYHNGSTWIIPMVLSNTGNVGIGTISPLTKLTVSDGSILAHDLSGTGNAGLSVQKGIGNRFWINPLDTHRLAIGGTGTIPPGDGAITIWAQGPPLGTYVGIGTTSPGQKLDVKGNVNATKYYGDGSALTGISTGKWDGTKPGNIYYNDGKVGIGTTAPGYKLDVSGTIRSTDYISTKKVQTFKVLGEITKLCYHVFSLHINTTYGGVYVQINI